MSKADNTLTLKRWQANVLMLLAGFACGNILAKTIAALFG